MLTLTVPDVPTYIVAGDSSTFDVLVTDHPFSEGWTMQYSIVFGTNAPTLFTAVEGPDDGHTVNMDAATTAGMPIGKSAAYAVFALGSERVTYQMGFIYVQPNPLLPLPVTWARETLELVKTALQKIGQSSNAQVSINGETYNKQSLSALMAFHDRLVHAISNEEAAAGRRGSGGFRTIRTRFTN